jgi:DNA-binding Lrp family transcriptional regulator
MKKTKYEQEMDIYDKKIICELDINARASSSDIAKSIRLPKETVNFRIKRLINKGYINYFYTIINASRLGYQYYKIFLKLLRLY